MYRQKILDSFVLPQPQPHTPAFRLEPERGGCRIFDGETAIGFCWPTFFDLWSFAPGRPALMANTEPPGKVVDLHTVHNTVLNLALHGWPRHWHASSAQLKWDWRRRGGERIEVLVSAAFADGERIQWVFQIGYDPVWGRYRYTFEINAWKRDPEGMEPFNMMLAGALTERAHDRRWTHSIWEDPDENLRRIVHSNALFTATDYASAQWRTRNMPYSNGWVAYAAHNAFNPAMLVHRANVPMKLATCSQLFDEHIIWNDAGQENLDEDGLFQFHTNLEFVNLLPAMAAEFLNEATDPVQPKQWREEQIALPFYMDTTNSFEETVDPWKPEECPTLVIPKDEGPVCWVRGTGHSGRCSVRLEATRTNERCECFPGGAVCRVRPHRRYRLSGWIKTESVERFARLELAGYEYTFTNTIDSARSAHVTGTSDWTQVSVELDSGDEAYLMPRMVLYGPGAAWFDDLRLEEATAPRA